MQNWTQDQAIAFESARECIVHLMAICSAEIFALESQVHADGSALEILQRKQTLLAQELRSLRLQDTERVCQIRLDYGRQVRGHR